MKYVFYLTLGIFLLSLYTDQDQMNFDTLYTTSLTAAFFFGKFVGILGALSILAFLLQMLIIGAKKVKALVIGQ